MFVGSYSSAGEALNKLSKNTGFDFVMSLQLAPVSQ